MILPLGFEQPANGEDRRVPAELLMFALTHPAKESLHDRGVVGARQLSQPLGHALWHNPAVRQGPQRGRGSVLDRRWQGLPADDPRKPPVEVVATEPFVTTVSRERDGH